MSHLLSFVNYHLHNEGVLVVEGSLHQHPQPVSLADELCVPLVGRQVDGQGHDLKVDLKVKVVMEYLEYSKI